MLYFLVELPRRMAFDPFKATTRELFDLFTDSTMVHRDYWNQEWMDVHFNSLKDDMLRYILLEVMIDKTERPDCTFDDFEESLAAADFCLGYFKCSMKKPALQSQ